jgi:hypothetical protein
MRVVLICLFFLAQMTCSGQNFAPAPGYLGSTAIHKDSSIIKGWAGIPVIERGWLDIANKSLGFVTQGDATLAQGKAEGDGANVVSLGDSGVAIYSFLNPLVDGPGFDFVVFENGFADNYMELAFVEVSSDGIHFVRFPSTSESSTITQMSNFTFGDCRMINNLAGKYRQGYGTPFDLSELSQSKVLNLQKITHIKIVDVIGNIDPLYGSRDAYNNIINDPYPTSFASGGFDLDALGIINQVSLGLPIYQENVKIYPNPAKDYISISYLGQCDLEIYSFDGRLLKLIENFEGGEISTQSYKGEIILRLIGENIYCTQRVLVME